MSKGRHRLRLVHWWVLCIVLILAAEAVVCAVIFIPQYAAYNRAVKDKAFVIEQFEKLRLTASSKKFEDLDARVGESKELLSSVRLFSEAPAQQVVMRAIAKADVSAGMVVLSLARSEESSGALSKERRRRYA